MKALLCAGLTPLARLSDAAGGMLVRLWSFARLQASLGQRLDPSIVVLGMPELHGTRRIRLGRNLYLYRELYLETRAEAVIVIGDDVVLSRGVHLVAHAGITIGSGSMIGEYSSVRDANHRIGSGHALRSAGHKAAAIVIGQNVWIGRGVTILPGVTIGAGAVIGANSVVRHNVDAGIVVGGIPAQALKRALAP
jgi:acetyltransferase-like isoleucine patch superfamily enzyme